LESLKVLLRVRTGWVYRGLQSWAKGWPGRRWHLPIRSRSGQSVAPGLRL